MVDAGCCLQPGELWRYVVASWQCCLHPCASYIHVWAQHGCRLCLYAAEGLRQQHFIESRFLGSYAADSMTAALAKPQYQGLAARLGHLSVADNSTPGACMQLVCGAARPYEEQHSPWQ